MEEKDWKGGGISEKGNSGGKRMKIVVVVVREGGREGKVVCVWWGGCVKARKIKKKVPVIVVSKVRKRGGREGSRFVMYRTGGREGLVIPG